MVLRPPTSIDRHSFRACLKIHRPVSGHRDATNQTENDLIGIASGSANRHARIYLEAPKRLITLYADGDTERADNQLVKCFMSIHEQVALYVEAEGVYRSVVRSLSVYLFFPILLLLVSLLWSSSRVPLFG